MADQADGAASGATPDAGAIGLGDGGGELAGVGQGPLGTGQGAGSPDAGKVAAPVQPRPTTEAGKVERKPVAPIPPKRSRLPGVMVDDDFPEVDAFVKAPLKVAHAEAIGERARDEAGRFVKAPESGTGEAPATKPVLPGQPATPEAAAPVAPFKFAGRDYKTQAEAEQSHRSLQGMFKPMQEELRKTAEDRDYGNRAANAWMAEAQRFQARVAELEKQYGLAPSVGNGTSQPAQAAPGESDALSVEKLLEGIDVDAYEAVARAGGLKHSAKYLTGEILKVVAEKVLPSMEQRIQAKFAPLMSSHEQAARVQQADQVIARMAALRTPDNSRALFPEMVDSRALGEIGAIWRQAGGSDEELTTERGLMSAIGLYRSTRDWLSTPESIAPNQPQAPAAAAAAAPQPAPGPAAMPSSETSGNLPPNRGRHGMSPEAARLAQAMENVQLLDPKLGFAKNRPSAAAR